MLLIFIKPFFPLSICCNFNSINTFLKLHKNKNSWMRTTYHCNRTVKEHCLWVSPASGYGLICGREDEAVATDSLSAYNLVYGKGDLLLLLRKDVSSFAPLFLCSCRCRSSCLSRRDNFETVVLQMSHKKICSDHQVF